MITYKKGFPSPYSLIFRIHGAAYIRTLFPALLSSVITLVLNVFVPDNKIPANLKARTGWHHPYTYQTFAFIVGFAIVFRNSTAYQRYNQARIELQTLSGKLVEAAVQVCGFDLMCTEEAKEQCKVFRHAFIHHLSMLHGLMLQYVRSDWNLDNLEPHVRGRHPIQDSSKLPNFNRFLYRWNFWSSVLCLQTGLDVQETYNALMPLLVIDGINHEEKDSLYKDMDGGDLAHGPLAPSGVRVETCYAWIHRLLVARLVSGGLQMPAPIFSRTYQVLNDGMNSFNQCRGLSDTPFPFPYSQAIILILVIYTLTIPLLMWIWVESHFLAVLLTFCATFTYWTLNEIARDLEDPFLYEPNDFPLARLQFIFNEKLLAVERETGNLDRPPALGRTCSQWLSQDYMATFQDPLSAKYYETFEESQQTTYFNCTVTPHKKKKRKKRLGSGVFGHSVFSSIHSTMRGAESETSSVMK